MGKIEKYAEEEATKAIDIHMNDLVSKNSCITQKLGPQHINGLNTANTTGVSMSSILGTSSMLDSSDVRVVDEADSCIVNGQPLEGKSYLLRFLIRLYELDGKRDSKEYKDLIKQLKNEVDSVFDNAYDKLKDFKPRKNIAR